MKNKRILAAKILKTSLKKVKFAVESLDDIKKAITRSDLRGLIAVGTVSKIKPNSHSRSGARKIKAQKRKGRQKGKGSKKGGKNSVVSKKKKWMAKVRSQRVFLRELRVKGLLVSQDYQKLYARSKGGFFRNKRHIKLFITEHHLIKEKSERPDVVREIKK
jgi:large subunit ribosomal protein L19e